MQILLHMLVTVDEDSFPTGGSAEQGYTHPWQQCSSLVVSPCLIQIFHFLRGLQDQLVPVSHLGSMLLQDAQSLWQYNFSNHIHTKSFFGGKFNSLKFQFHSSLKLIMRRKETFTVLDEGCEELWISKNLQNCL